MNTPMSPCSNRRPLPAKAALLASIAGELSSTDSLPRRKPSVQLPRQLAGPAAEIDDAHSWSRLYQIEQIDERPCPLVAEPRVLLRVPVG